MLRQVSLYSNLRSLQEKNILYTAYYRKRTIPNQSNVHNICMFQRIRQIDANRGVLLQPLALTSICLYHCPNLHQVVVVPSTHGDLRIGGETLRLCERHWPIVTCKDLSLALAFKNRFGLSSYVFLCIYLLTWP